METHFKHGLTPTVRSLQPAASGEHRDLQPKVCHLDVVTECIQELMKVAAGVPDLSQVCIYSLARYNILPIEVCTLHHYCR